MSSHIALFLPSLEGGGAERVMVTLANGFAAAGHRVDLVLVSTNGPYLSEVSDRVRIVNFKGGRVISGLLPLARYLRRERPAALLSAMTHVNIIAIFAKILAGGSTRLVVSEHSAPSRNLVGGGANRVMRFLIRNLFSRADKVISVSQGIQRELADLFELPPANLAVVYNPIDTPKIRSMMNEPVVHPWIAHKDLPMILAAGRLTEAKDYPNLLRAFALLRARKPARLVILGRGEEEAALKKLTEDLELTPDVFFAGFQANPYAWMRGCDLYVMSSAWEGLPGALMEALTCHAKVVSTDCPTGPNEVLENGRWGKLVPVGDAQALSQAMEEALAAGPPPSPEESLARFQTDTVVQQYLDLMIGSAPAISGARRND